MKDGDGDAQAQLLSLLLLHVAQRMTWPMRYVEGEKLGGNHVTKLSSMREKKSIDPLRKNP